MQPRLQPRAMEPRGRFAGIQPEPYNPNINYEHVLNQNLERLAPINLERSYSQQLDLEELWTKEELAGSNPDWLEEIKLSMTKQMLTQVQNQQLGVLGALLLNRFQGLKASTENFAECFASYLLKSLETPKGYCLSS